MLNDLEIELYTDETINLQIIEEWFNKINSHRFGTFENIPKAEAWHVGKPFFFKNEFLPGEVPSDDKLYLSLLNKDEGVDEQDSSPASAGPDGALLVILTDKALKDVSTTEILEEYLKEIYPKEVIGHDSHYVWFNGQMIFCHMWSSQGIVLVKISQLSLPYIWNFSFIQLLEGCINRFKEKLEYAD